MKKARSPDLDLGTLISVAEDEPAAGEDSHQGLLEVEALKAWKESLVRREALVQRLDALREEQRALEATVDLAPGSSPRLEPAAQPATVALPFDRRSTPWAGFDRVDPERLASAHATARIGTQLPDFHYYGPVRRLFARVAARGVLFLSGIVTVHQRIYNEALLGVVQDSTDQLNRIGGRLGQLHRDFEALGASGERLSRDCSRELTEAAAARERLMERSSELLAALESMKRRQERLEARERIARLELELELTSVGKDRAWMRLVELESRRRIDELGDELEATRAAEGEILTRVPELERLHGQHLEITDQERRRLDAVVEQVGALRRADASTEAAMERAQRQAEQSSTAIEERLSAVGADQQATRAQITDLERALGRSGRGAPHDFDALYVNLENRFRGSRELVRQRLEPYLELLDEPEVGADHRPIIDLGCGRGEWLELLQEKGMVALGVDSNEVAVEGCRRLGLDAVRDDAMHFLRSLPEARAGVVSAFHLVEHLRFEYLIHLLDEALRVLHPGGLLILESPNPENLEVSANWFHCDPTHRRPINPHLMSFLVTERGFVDAELQRLSEHRSTEPLPRGEPTDASAPRLDALIEVLNRRLCGPPDYSVTARKPG